MDRYITSIIHIPDECKKCKGKHWDPNSQKKTQERVLEEFGIIPNPCVNGEGGVIHCPVMRGFI